MTYDNEATPTTRLGGTFWMFADSLQPLHSQRDLACRFWHHRHGYVEFHEDQERQRSRVSLAAQ